MSKTLHQVTRRGSIRTYKGSRTVLVPFTMTAKLEHLEGNALPHFSVTAEYCDGGGCMHEEILKRWPAIKPVIDLHLSDSEGQPMHAVANGWYWIAGAIPGGMGEEYHGGSGSGARPPEACLQIAADHLRISLAEATQLRDTLQRMNSYTPDQQGYKAACRAPKQAFALFCKAQAERWKAEAVAAIALIERLNQEKITKENATASR